MRGFRFSPWARFGLFPGPHAWLGATPPTLSLDFLSSTALDSRITFSRTTNATLVDATGRVTYAPNNLLLRSEEFDNAVWTKANATVTADATAAPNGTTTADAIIENTATATHGVTAAVSVTTGISYVFSVYAKQNGRSLLRVGSADSQKYGVFDLIAGVVQYADAGVSASIAPVGNGWYRCAVTERATLTGTGTYLFRMQSDTSQWPGTGQYTGNGTSGVFLWGAQFEAVTYQTLPSTYVQTVASAYYGPRFDYNPVTLAPRGLLIEEQRVNSIRNSIGVGAVAGTPGTAPTNWSVSTSGSGITREIVGTGMENGVSYIDVRFFGTPTASIALSIAFEGVNNIAAASGQTWAESAYVKLQAGSFAGAQTSINILGTNGAAGTESFGSADFTSTPSNLAASRISLTATLANASTTFVQPRVRIGVTNGVPFDITLRIGLPQLELGAFATSVIPTATAAATRAVDVASMTGANFSSWYNASEGTLFAAISSAAPTVAGAARRIANINNGTESNRITVTWAGSTGVSAAFVTDAGATQANFVSPAGAYAFPTQVALAYKINDFQASVNGSTFTADTSGSIPSVDRLTLGDVVSGGTGPQNLNGHIRTITYYATRLTNAQLQALAS